MLLALIHLTPRAHTPLDERQSGTERAISRQGFHQGVGAIAHHLGQFDQTALCVVPGKEDDEPVLQHHPNQFGIDFTQGAPGIGRAPLVDLGVLLPQFLQQFHLPAFAQEHQSRLKGQLPGRRIRHEDRPVGQAQGLL